MNAQVLYSKFGFMYTDLKLNKEDYILIREDDVIGIMPRPSKYMFHASYVLLLKLVLGSSVAGPCCANTVVNIRVSIRASFSTGVL